MEVAYARFNNPIELDFFDSSTKLRGTEHRLGILEALADEGHDVTIVSKIRGGHGDLLDGVQQDGFAAFIEDEEEDDPIDYHFLSQIDSDEQTRDMDRFDVLLIECGPTNTQFSYKSSVPGYQTKFGTSTPYIWRVFDLIDQFEGHVIYYQHDIKLGFPFLETTREPTPGVARNNLTRMGSEVDFWENKDWTIMTHALDPSTLEDHFSEIRRYSYDEFPLSWTVVPICYSDNVDLRFEPRREESLKHDLVHVGSGDRSAERREKIWDRLDLSDWDVGIVGGGWREEGWDRGDIFYHGRVGDHGDVYEIQNWAAATLQIGDPLFEDVEMITGRICAGARGGNIVLIDDDLATGRYIDPHWHVSDRDDIRDRLEEISEMSYEERLETNERQLDRLSQWTDFDWNLGLSYHGSDIRLTDDGGAVQL